MKNLNILSNYRYGKNFEDLSSTQKGCINVIIDLCNISTDLESCNLISDFIYDSYYSSLSSKTQIKVIQIYSQIIKK